MTNIVPFGKINKNGIYDLTMDAYHGQPCVGPSVSSTGLRKIITASPAHFWEGSSLNPDRTEQIDTAAFRMGKAAHHLLLGEDGFVKQFVVRPETLEGAAWQGNRTVCRKWLADQENAGKIVLKIEDIMAIRGMAVSLEKHPLVRAGILNGQIEKSFIWKDEETGIWCKARPDAIPNDSGDFGDLKTTIDIGYKLDNAVDKYRYDMQAALVGMGSRTCLGREMEEFSFVFVEKNAPYSVDVLTLDAADIAEAEKDVRAALRVMAHCLKTGEWFGPSGTQSDARYVHRSAISKARSQSRREFLDREITSIAAAPAQIVMQAAE